MRIKSIYWNFGQNKPEKSFRYIDTSSIDRKKNIINYKNLQYLSPEQAPSRARKLVSQNSVLFSTVRPYLKNIAVVRELKEYLIASTAFIVLDTLLNETYLKYYLLSDNFINRVNNKSTGTSYPAINDYNFNLLLIALPPLSEQQRIVEAIESALEKVDEYAESYNRLEQLDKEFPDKLKKSILQYAMQGKLVEQDPNDESVEVLLEKIRAEKQKLFEEGKIKKKDLEISIVSKGDDNSYYEEVPYDIPESWMFVKLNVVANIFSGYSFKSSEYSNEGIRIVRISDFDENGLINKNIVRQKYQEKFNKFEIYQNDILLAMTGGTVGKNTILQTLPERMFLNQRVANIRSYYIKYNFIYHFLNTPRIYNLIQKQKNSTNDNISLTDIQNFLIPLPPLSEQTRIVEKIELSFAHIDALI
ncbi:type I restriction-modification system S protein [Streptococcus pneumoniae]|uniref:Type I restriction-modification system S protein n=1 Tax=Streptococcus pneumoniae TaxID=1313 RepID=A0AA95IJ17_STREE|nr:restriction endonuclease subunit S [Streptococcus pneumoniae]MDS3489485.1 restriction endonuclease subunit S [Streptococcus pneumoniae]MDS4886256.1 restriction endonuclease subunit S [Streptococcus pneumoniae]MDS5010797.1 restriction endonuclease subunit S [Streptococcus pneumoniae]MDS5405754.1 restriction endonuclease subunit S [Streptococcus pneumoniae]